MAELWGRQGIGIVDVVWLNPKKVRVKFWHGGSAWVRQGDMLQGYITSTGVIYSGVLRRKYRN
jgi:hypothetical protein